MAAALDSESALVGITYNTKLLTKIFITGEDEAKYKSHARELYGLRMSSILKGDGTEFPMQASIPCQSRSPYLFGLEPEVVIAPYPPKPFYVG